MMKKFNVFSLYAIGLLLSACTASVEDALSGNSPGQEAGGISGDRRQVDVLMRNKLVLGGASTKANGDIATTEENEVTAMDVYVFASETEYGEYTFQERLTYRAGEEVAAADGVTPFTLLANTSDNAFSTARLAVRKGLYVKLYCVANAPKLYRLDESGTAYVAAEFQPLQSERSGDVTHITAAGIPTEKDFLASYTAPVIEPTNPEDVIHTPLLMRGNVPGCMDLTNLSDNTDINASMKLVRGVARFDIQNNADDSHLTIEAVGMTQGNATTALFPFDGRPAADGSLIDYPLRYFYGDDLTAVNHGKKSGAFYSYAAPEGACLLLKGHFTTNSQEEKEVNYQVPFKSLTDGNGNEISIEPNHRYTVVVNEADPYQIKLSITVADWEEGGSLDDMTTDQDNVSGMSEPVMANVHNSYVYDNKAYQWVALYANTAEDKFTVKISSNSAVECRMKFGDYSVTKAETGTDTGSGEPYRWLDVKCEEKAGGNGSSWSTDYTFTFSVSSATVSDQAKSFPPVVINFVSAVGTARTIRVESLTYTLDGKSMTNATAYGENEYWYVDRGSGTWDQAMEACPADQGWYLPSMNDYRNLFRVDNWNTVDLPFNTTPYLNLFNQTNERSISNSYLQKFFTSYSYPNAPSYTCNESLYNKTSSSRYGNYYDYFWSSDLYDANTGRSIKLHASTYAYTRCSRKAIYDSQGHFTGKYDYTYSYPVNGLNSYLTYEKASRTASKHIRCVKRRPGNPVYPY